MFKLTASSVAAILSMLGFGYSVSSYSSPSESAEATSLRVPVQENFSIELVNTPLIKVNGVKLKGPKAYTFSEIKNQAPDL